MTPLRAMDDAQLLTEFYQPGGAEALGELHRRYWVRLAACAEYLLSRELPGREQTACDLAQTVFIRVLQTQGRPSAWWQPEKGTVADWLFGILRHLCCEYVRKKGNTKIVPQSCRPWTREEEQVWDTLRTETTPGPATAAANAEQRQNLRDCVDDLPKGVKGVVLGVFWEGRQKQALARELGLSPAGATRRLQTAFKLLKDCLSRKDLRDREPVGNHSGEPIWGENREP